MEECLDKIGISTLCLGAIPERHKRRSSPEEEEKSFLKEKLAKVFVPPGRFPLLFPDFPLRFFFVGLQRTCFKRGLPFAPLHERRDVTKFAKNMHNRWVFHSLEIESVESGASGDQVSAPGNEESGNFENKEREGWLFHFLFSLFSRRTKKFCKNP